MSVHGQATQLRLRSEKAQRETLDSFGGAAHQAALRDYLQAWEDWKSAQSQYRDWEENTAARAQRMQALREVLEEFEKLDPQGGEFDQLASQIAKLSNVESLRENLAAALMALSSPDMDYPGASDQVIVAARALEKAAQEDPALEEVFNSIESSRYALAEAVRDIEAYLQDLAADPQLLQENLSRRAALNDLGRKVGVDPNDLDRAWQSAAEELRSISGGEEKLAELRRLLDESHAALLDATRRLGLMLSLTDLPDWYPARAITTFIDGGRYTYEKQRWSLELNATTTAATGRGLTWNQLPPGLTWNHTQPLSWAHTSSLTY